MPEHSAQMDSTSEVTIFSGKGGFASLTRKTVNNSAGALLRITNPTSKVNTVTPEVILEINQALDALENEKALSFLILFGTGDKIHAGADVKMFSGGLTKEKNFPDYEKVREYLLNGTKLDVRIKKLSQKITTVSIIQGERFGGSVEWPLMARYSVATPEAGISLSEPCIGIIPGWNGILNILLKTGIQNTLYLGTTSQRIGAETMLDLGIISAISSPESVMNTALDLAVSASKKSENSKVPVIFPINDELFEILSRRMNPERYKTLLQEMTKLKEAQRTDAKELSKIIDRKLEEMGKPLAPLAVEAIFGLIAKYGGRISRENFDAIQQMAFDEAESCQALMTTHDRVAGMDSVLKARENPLLKIPIYQRK